MDNTKGPKMTRRIRIPFNGGTLRSLPFERHHLVALTMAQQLTDGQRQFSVVLRLLTKLLGDDYHTVIDAFVDGEVQPSDLTELLNAIVQGTKTIQGSATEPTEPERDPETLTAADATA